MSDTPIAEQLAAALDMPWPLRPWRMQGDLFEPDLRDVVADPNCDKCGGQGVIITTDDSGGQRIHICGC